MLFSELLRGTCATAAGGDPAIRGLDYDSRRIQPGWLFVAMRGESTDGNRYIEAAIQKGAVAVVTDAKLEPPRQGIAWARVDQGRRALATLSSNFYKHPAGQLQLIGITGTNGKTTTTFVCDAILRHGGQKTALIGTIEYRVAGRIVPAPHTTPESLELNRIFSEAVAAGATHAVMEVSSHALEQERVWGVPYRAAVFTNLTRDHLDYHKDMTSYFAAKSVLFQGCGTPPPQFAVINTDDEYGQTLARTQTDGKERVIRYGIRSGNFRAANVDLRPNGSTFELVTPEMAARAVSVRISTALIGAVNVYNILAAAGATFALGCPLEQIAAAVEGFKQVPGRFERVDCGQPFSVIVDYAHTDDALRNLTRIAREFVRRGPGRCRVITVFGCGGDRDRTKRPLMGEAAGEGSDFVVLTSDNPRSEDPARIIADALPGLERTRTRHTVEPDRKLAIRTALVEAFPGDMVLIAGKGHEKVQITREGTFPFDDVQVARNELEQLGYAACADAKEREGK